MTPEDPPKSAKVAIVDTETTGLGPFDQPITVGLILLEVDLPKGGLIRECESYYGMREPSVPIGAEAQRVHGLSIGDLRGRSFDLPRIVSMLNDADFVVAHNASFDARMLCPLFTDLHRKRWRCSVNQIWWSDSTSIPNRKLDTICAHFGIERPNPHNALDDAQALSTALLKRTGSTDRSRTYLGALLARPDLDIPPPAKARHPKPLPAPAQTEAVAPRRAPAQPQYWPPKQYVPPPKETNWAHILYGAIFILLAAMFGVATHK